ncbi:MAG TPA: ATP-binding protein [Candidatus Bathyarchaeia archaeon]|nr:ATP-binding protein [Candidatus Bathyarchaeia archaeon]
MLWPENLARSTSSMFLLKRALPNLPPGVSSSGNVLFSEVSLLMAISRVLSEPLSMRLFWNSEQKDCSCTPQQVQKYRSRLSGPLLDRIDIHLEVPRVSVEDMDRRIEEESSSAIQLRIEQAKLIQEKRFSDRPHHPFNSGMNGRDIRSYIRLEKEARDMLRLTFEKMGLSARAYDRILKVARTVADLESSEQVETSHVAEAIRYRALDRDILG